MFDQSETPVFTIQTGTGRDSNIVVFRKTPKQTQEKFPREKEREHGRERRFVGQPARRGGGAGGGADHRRAARGAASGAALPGKDTNE